MTKVTATRARRGSGEGAVYQRADGVWCATIDLGRSSDGTRRRRVVKAKTKALVLAKISKAKADIAEGGPIVTSRTPADTYLRWWLADVVEPRVASGGLKRSSAFRYGQVITSYVIPCWGSTPLVDIGPEHVDRLLRGLEAKGLANATVKQARTVASLAMRDAVRWGKLRVNPVTAVPGPRQSAGQLDAKVDDVLTGDEALHLLKLAKDDRLSALAIIILRLGVRKGEALALRWDDIDFEGSRLRIERTRTRVAGVGVMETKTKTRGSERTIPLTVTVHAALLRHRKLQGAEARFAGPAWKGEGYVFCTPTGEGLDPRNALRWWHRLTEQAGLGKRRMHAGRHTAATLLLGAGVPLEVVSAILGHSGIAITADTYARVLEDAKRKAFAAVDLDAEGGPESVVVAAKPTDRASRRLAAIDGAAPPVPAG